MMVASTSHDMRTPLNTILNMQDLILKKLPKDDAELNRWLLVSKTSTNILMCLVNDTLDFH